MFVAALTASGDCRHRRLVLALPVLSKIQPVGLSHLSDDAALHRLHLSACVALEAAAAPATTTAPANCCMSLSGFHCFQSPYTQTDGQTDGHLCNILFFATFCFCLRFRRCSDEIGTRPLRSSSRMSSGSRLCFIQLSTQSSELIRVTFCCKVTRMLPLLMSSRSQQFPTGS